MRHPVVNKDCWYYPPGATLNEQPLAAKVAFVHNPHLVNLGGFLHNGRPFAELNVPFVLDQEEYPADAGFATWMPFLPGLENALVRIP